MCSTPRGMGVGARGSNPLAPASNKEAKHNRCSLQNTTGANSCSRRYSLGTVAIALSIEGGGKSTPASINSWTGRNTALCIRRSSARCWLMPTHL